jgi:hypothetical protein
MKGCGLVPLDASDLDAGDLDGSPINCQWCGFDGFNDCIYNENCLHERSPLIINEG